MKTDAKFVYFASPSANELLLRHKAVFHELVVQHCDLLLTTMLILLIMCYILVVI
jgi:hypothetical protein